MFVYVRQARKDYVMDPCLSDLCIGATAAPTYFPAHNFKTATLWPLKWEDFHLVDAGVFANNPVIHFINIFSS